MNQFVQFLSELGIPMIVNIVLLVILAVALLFSIIHGVKRGVAVTLIRLPFALIALFLSVFITKYACTAILDASMDSILSAIESAEGSSNFINNINYSKDALGFIIASLFSVVFFGFAFFIVDKVLYIPFAIIKKIMSKTTDEEGEKVKRKHSGASKFFGVLVSMATCVGFFIIYTAPYTATINMVAENRQVIEAAYTAIVETSEEGEQTVALSKNLSDENSMTDGSASDSFFIESLSAFEEANSSVSFRAVNLCGGKYMFSYLTSGKIGSQETSLSTELEGTCLIMVELPELMKSLQALGRNENGSAAIDTQPFIAFAEAISSSKAVAPKALATDVMASLDDIIDAMSQQASEDDATAKVLNALKPLFDHFNSSTPETIGNDIVTFANNTQNLAVTLDRVTNIDFGSMDQTIESIGKIFEDLTPESAQIIVDVVENLDLKDLGVELTPSQESAINIVTNSVVDIVELAANDKESYDAEVGALGSIMDAFNSGSEATEEQIKTAINDVLETTVISSAITQAVKDESGEIKNDAFGVGQTLSEENKAVVIQELNEYKANNADCNQETIDALAAIFGVQLG